MQIRSVLLLLLACWLPLAGCNRSQLDTAPVSGVVTLDEKPVSHVLVVFQPTHGIAEQRGIRPSSSGMTNEEGRFQLDTSDWPGALIGEHVVTLIYKDPTADPDGSTPHGSAAFELPPASRDRSLRFTVPPGGTTNADFALESASELPAETPPDAEEPAVSRTAGVPRPVEAPHPAEEVSSRDRTEWYLTTLAVWFVVLLGCIIWWRFNMRQLRKRTDQPNRPSPTSSPSE